MKTNSNQITLLTTFDQFSQRNINRTNQLKRLINYKTTSLDISNTTLSQVLNEQNKNTNIDIIKHRFSMSMTTLPISKIEESNSIQEQLKCENNSLISVEENSQNIDMIDNYDKESIINQKGFINMKNNLPIRKISLNNITNSYLLALGDNKNNLLENKLTNSIIEEEKSEMITDSETSNKKKNALKLSQKKMQLVSGIMSYNENNKDDMHNSNVKNLNKVFVSSMRMQGNNDLLKLIERIMKKKRNKYKDKNINILFKTNKQCILKPPNKIENERIEDSQMISNCSVPVLSSSTNKLKNKKEKVMTIDNKLSGKININQLSYLSFRNMNNNNKVFTDIPKAKKSKVLLTKACLIQFTSTRNKYNLTKKTKSNSNKTSTTNNTNNTNISEKIKSESLSNQHRDYSKSQMNLFQIKTHINNNVNNKERRKSHSIFNIRNPIKTKINRISNKQSIQNLLLSPLITYLKPNYQQEALNKLKMAKGKLFLIYIDLLQKNPKKQYVFKGLFHYYIQSKMLIRLNGRTDCPTVLFVNQLNRILINKSEDIFIEKECLSSNDKEKAMIIIKRSMMKQ